MKILVNASSDINTYQLLQYNIDQAISVVCTNTIAIVIIIISVIIFIAIVIIIAITTTISIPTLPKSSSELLSVLLSDHHSSLCVTSFKDGRLPGCGVWR